VELQNSQRKRFYYVLIYFPEIILLYNFFYLFVINIFELQIYTFFFNLQNIVNGRNGNGERICFMPTFNSG